MCAMSLAVPMRSLPQPRWLKPARSDLQKQCQIFCSGVDLQQQQVLRDRELWHGSGAVAPLEDLREDLLAGGAPDLLLPEQRLRR